MGKFIDLTGQQFGRLMVIERAKSSDYENASYANWVCKCDCGNMSVHASRHLRSGRVRSCGCLAKELTAKRSQTHGGRHTRLYEIWTGMKKRCYNSGNQAYSKYGGRGIMMCDAWKNDFESFQDWALSSGYSDELSIDRIDNDGNYEPSNCRWATRKIQSVNRSNVKQYELGGELKTLGDWAAEYGLTRKTLNSRLQKGWALEKALTTPPAKIK